MNNPTNLTYHKNLFSDNKSNKIFSFLDAVPSTIFSVTGERNICNRFKITIDELNEHVKAHLARKVAESHG